MMKRYNLKTTFENGRYEVPTVLVKSIPPLSLDKNGIEIIKCPLELNHSSEEFRLWAKDYIKNRFNSIRTLGAHLVARPEDAEISMGILHTDYSFDYEHNLWNHPEVVDRKPEVYNKIRIYGMWKVTKKCAPYAQPMIMLDLSTTKKEDYSETLFWAMLISTQILWCRPKYRQEQLWYMMQDLEPDECILWYHYNGDPNAFGVFHGAPDQNLAGEYNQRHSVECRVISFE